MSNPCCHQEDLLLFYYAELDPAARSRVEEHLETCPSCRDRLRELTCLLDNIPRPEIEISPAEIARFAARVAERAGAGRAWRTPFPVWGGALAAAAVLIVTLMAERPHQVRPTGTGSTQMAELEILQSLELLQDFELLQDLELLEELERRG